jgi:hypothetical protein
MRKNENLLSWQPIALLTHGINKPGQYTIYLTPSVLEYLGLIVSV